MVNGTYYQQQAAARRRIAAKAAREMREGVTRSHGAVSTYIWVGGRTERISWSPDSGLSSARYTDLEAEKIANILTASRDLLLEALLEIDHLIATGATPSALFERLNECNLTVTGWREKDTRNCREPVQLALLSLSRLVGVRREVAGNHRTSSRVLSRLAQDTHAAVREQAASNPHLPPGQMRLLINRGHAPAVAINPAAPPEILVEIAERQPAESVVLGLAANPRFPLEKLDLLYRLSPRTAPSIAKRKDATPELLDLIADEKSCGAAVAGHRNLSEQTALRLIAKQGIFLAANPRPLSLAEQRALAAHPDPRVRHWLGRRSELSFELAIQLAQDPSAMVRRRILEKFPHRHLVFSIHATHGLLGTQQLGEWSKPKDIIEMLIAKHGCDLDAACAELRHSPRRALSLLDHLVQHGSQQHEPLDLEQLVEAARQGVTGIADEALAAIGHHHVEHTLP